MLDILPRKKRYTEYLQQPLPSLDNLKSPVPHFDMHFDYLVRGEREVRSGSTVTIEGLLAQMNEREVLTEKDNYFICQKCKGTTQPGTRTPYTISNRQGHPAVQSL